MQVDVQRTKCIKKLTQNTNVVKKNLKNYTQVVAVDTKEIQMAGVTRVVGLGVTAGTLYSHNVKAYLITVQVAGNTDVDLRAEDDAVDEAAEMIMKEISPLMYFVKNDASGEICVIMDGNSSAADIQARIRALGTAVGPNDIDVTGTDVTLATSLTTA